jgi:hypothetical protein
MRMAVWILIATTGCARLPGLTKPLDKCNAPKGAALSVIDSASRSLLEGSFRLVQVGSREGRKQPTVRLLRLHLADSVERANARARRPGNKPRNLEIAGTSKTVSSGQLDPAELDGPVLFVGCRECSDASPDALTLFAVGEGGFIGRWLNPSSGIEMVVRQNSRNVLTSPGHFCATRLPPEDPAPDV